MEPTHAISLASVLACPRCAGALELAPAVRCAGCGASFPVIDGIPWLVAEPGLLRAEWLGRLRALVTELEAQATRYRSALTDAVTRAATRNRLKLLAAACQDHARRLRALLAPLGAPDANSVVETYRALLGPLPVGQGLTGYYANLHRDWAWGEAENELAVQAVGQAMAAHDPGRVLVLGCGAGRLAYDLHGRRRPSLTVAADLNPLMLAVARRMYVGDAVELYEFPVAPRDLDSQAILRRLAAPAPAPAGLHLVLADASHAPFGCAAFDTVVTPWLVDILDEDFATFVRRVRHWLRPGGRWVSSGSLCFRHRDPARCYSTEEVLDIVAGAGFGEVQLTEQLVPYLASPASRNARHEHLVTIEATRDAGASSPPRAHSAVPDWLASSEQAVPLVPELSSQVLSMRVYAFVASLVDGQRTVRDIAEVLVRERLLVADEAESTVRSFLRRVLEDAQWTSGP